MSADAWIEWRRDTDGDVGGLDGVKGERRAGKGQRLVRKSPVTPARSDGRCNTIQCVDSRKFPRKNHLFSRTRSRPSQGSVSGGL